MKITKALVLLFMLFVTTYAAPKTPAVNTLGVGYNLVDGNPEGAPHKGNVDPGLKHTHRILELSYTKNRRTINDQITIPDQATFSERLACSNHVYKYSYHGAVGYQKDLTTTVSGSASGSYGLFSFAFTASAKFKNYQSGSSSTTTIKIEERRICNRGTARYLMENAGLPNSKIKLQRGFAAAIKRLPTRYNRQVYGRFLDEWGTHVITEVTVGSIYSKVTSITKQEAYKYSLQHNKVGLSVSGAYGGYSASVSLDVSRLTQDQSFTKSFSYKSHEYTRGSTITFRNGRWVLPNVKSFPEPITIKILTIDKIMTRRFTSSRRVRRRRSAMKRALREYHIYKSLHKLSKDKPVRIPVAWPKGTYGFVRTRFGNGCPEGTNAIFRTGERYHDTEDHNSNNKWSRPFDLWGYKGKNNMKWGFCMKVSNNRNNLNYQWPKGRYCILRFSGNCPKGFQPGYIYWDDEDSNNRNSYSGTMPRGQYDHNTRIDFCCRYDGSTATPIVLPTNKPFILMPTHHGPACQTVFGMRWSRQYFRWDDEDSNNRDAKGGSYPYDDGGRHNHKLWFCVYQRS